MKINIRGVVVVLLLLVDAHVSAVEFIPGWSESYHLDKVEFMTVFHEIQEKIVEDCDPDFEVNDVSNPVLRAQKLGVAPDMWFVPLFFGRGTTRTEFAFRSDNLYLSAFSNGAGNWFRLDVPEGEREHEIEGAANLGFSGLYSKLLSHFPKKTGMGNQAWEKLVGLDIGKERVLDAIAVTDSYNPNTTPESEIKRALVTLIVVFIESQRFPYIRQLVYEAWENGSGTLDKEGAELVVNWKRTSCAILIWDASPDKAKWDSREARELKKTGLGITTPESAKAAVWPIIQSENCSK